MTDQVLLEEVKPEEITGEDLQSIGELIGTLEELFKDPAFVSPTPVTAGSPGAGNASIMSTKNDVLNAIRDFIQSNKSTNVCEVSWDVFAAAAKVFCAGLTPFGGAVAMIALNALYLKMRKRCKST
ncbi:hypothetical protein K4A76_06835 [Pseudomonas sp. NEEL19]|uniref:hypothetical protein n=1 Tax=Pseudomonas sp. NEEL19 TaxID=2867409 RepID=UPI002368E3DC|nr:hypothetical protein [Pseudomonas sp. NEEL19]WDM60651.1 hypothetical protein K4A76_06835 [Pseudomonas sp. NEEL19]